MKASNLVVSNVLNKDINTKSGKSGFIVNGTVIIDKKEILVSWFSFKEITGIPVIDYDDAEAFKVNFKGCKALTFEDKIKIAAANGFTGSLFQRTSKF